LNEKKNEKSETEQNDDKPKQNDDKPKQTGQRGLGFKSLRGFVVHGHAADDTKITSIAYLCQIGGCHCVVAGELADGQDLFAEYNNGGANSAPVSVQAVKREASYVAIATKHSRVRGYGSSDSSEDGSGHHKVWNVRISFRPAGHATFGWFKRAAENYFNNNPKWSLLGPNCQTFGTTMVEASGTFFDTMGLMWKAPAFGPF